MAAGTLKTSPLKQMIAATSVGIVDGNILLDLCYEEDSRAAVDMNVVMLADGGLVETQATAEKDSYSRKQLGEMLDYAEKGIHELLEAQMVPGFGRDPESVPGRAAVTTNDPTPDLLLPGRDPRPNP